MYCSSYNLFLKHVLFQLLVHFFDLAFHVGDLILPGDDLPFKLFDLIIEHELELLQLLVLLLQVVDPFLLILGWCVNGLYT